AVSLPVPFAAGAQVTALTKTPAPETASRTFDAGSNVFFFSVVRPPPISTLFPYTTLFRSGGSSGGAAAAVAAGLGPIGIGTDGRSEEHTSELQSRSDLVCRLLLEKKNHARVVGRGRAGDRLRAWRLHLRDRYRRAPDPAHT